MAYQPLPKRQTGTYSDPNAINLMNQAFRNQQQAHIWEGRDVSRGKAQVVPVSCPTCGVQKLYRVGPRDSKGTPSYVQPTGDVFVPPSW